jgi:hypothetical protein
MFSGLLMMMAPLTIGVQSQQPKHQKKKKEKTGGTN